MFKKKEGKKEKRRYQVDIGIGHEELVSSHSYHTL